MLPSQTFPTALTDDFAVTDIEGFIRSTPSIELLPDGRIFMAWRGGNPYEDRPIGIAGQIFFPDGTKSGDLFVLSPDGVATAGNFSLTILADGTLLASWLNYGVGSSEYGMWAQKLTQNGARIGDPFNIVVQSDLDGRRPVEPEIQGTADGGFVASWATYQDGTGAADIFTRTFTDDGTPTSAQINITQHEPTTGPSPDFKYFEGRSTAPDIIAFEDGSHMVLWWTYNDEGEVGAFVSAQKFLSDGTADGDVFHLFSVPAYSNGSFYSIKEPTGIALADGGFAIAFVRAPQGEQSVAVLTFDADGTPRDGVAGLEYYPSGNPEGDENGRIILPYSNRALPSQYSRRSKGRAGGSFVIRNGRILVSVWNQLGCAYF